MMCAVGMHLGERGSMVLWRCVWLGRICLFSFFSPVFFLLKLLETRRAEEIGNTAN